MRQIWISRAGGPEVLEVREAPDPEPAAGQVRIRVAAVGVNFADLMARMGTYPDAPPLPFVPGYEVAGTIDAVGDGVEESRIGQPVAVLQKFGGYADVVVVDAIQAIPVPAGKSLQEAACLPVQGLTAYMLLEVFGRVREGDTVLVQNAGGGVGLMALDLILRRGATAVGTASAGKHERLRELGYSQLIDYRSEDFEEVLGPKSIDIVLDPIGGESWAKGLRVLKRGGVLGCFGFSAMAQGNRRSMFGALTAGLQVPWLKVNPVALMNANHGVYGVNMGRLWDDVDRVYGWVGDLFELWGQGEIRPRLDTTFGFDQAAEAHQYLHDRKNFGKVLLIP